MFEIETKLYVRSSIKLLVDDNVRGDGFARFSEETLPRTMTDAEFDALFHDPVGMVSLLEPNGTIRRVNQTTLDSMNVEESLLVGESLPALPGWADPTRDRLREAIDTAASGELVQLEVQNHAFDSDRWLHLSLWPALADDGTVEGLVARGVDVTSEKRTRIERQRMKRQRDEERELLARVLETAPIAIFVMNRDGEIVEHNSRLQRMLAEFGFDSVTQLTDTERATLLDADGTPLDTPQLVSDRVFETGSAIYGEKRGIGLADGSRRWLSVNAAPVFDEDGTVEYVVDCGIDITAQERQNRALQRAKQRVMVLNRVLRHDIRTRSNIIAGYTDLIKSRLESDSRAYEFADVVAETATELSEMGDTARKMERVVGEVDEVEPVAVCSVLAEAVERFERTYPSVPVAVDVPESLTAFGSAALTEAFFQLLQNGVVHNDATQPRLSLTAVRPETPTESIEIRIADNGPGIPTEEVAVIRRAEEDQLNHGSGLGLWFVNWLVEGLGGSLDFETGDGTTVVVRLRSET
jgi:PAS domain S-box-containing protein